MSHQPVDFKDLEFFARNNLTCAIQQALVIAGPPGVAKSKWFETTYCDIVADVYGVSRESVGYAEYLVAGKDAVEASGLSFPARDDDGDMVTQETRPIIIDQMREVSAQYAYVVFNFDELMQANTDMQNVLSHGLNAEKRTLNGWKIPDNIILCGTGNRMADKAGAKRLLSQIVDRCLICELQRDVDGWERNFAAENVHPLIVACAKANAETEGFFADAVPVEDVSFCTFRSLTQISQQLTAFIGDLDFDGNIPPVLEKLFAATIGPTAAKVVHGFIAQHDKVPTAEDIMRDPEGALVPDETGFQALAGNIAVGAMVDQETGERAIQYIVRLRPDLQVSLATKLLNRSARNGLGVGGPIAQDFIHKFHDLIPLAQSAGWK